MALRSAMMVDDSSISLLTGAVFLDVTADRMHQIKSGGSPDSPAGDVGNRDLWSVYSEWHEAVHVSQLVTCPYVRLIGFRLATVAKEASRRAAGPDPNLSELLTAYRESVSMLEARAADEFSAWEIIETHAVVQGLLWLTGSDPNNLRLLADHLYSEVAPSPSPEYVRILDAMADAVGDTEAVKLLPRLCFLALQTLDPGEVFAALSARVRDEGSASSLAASSPRAFCEWAGVDPSLISRSLRERDDKVEGRSWMRLFGHYFDRFERVSGTDARLDLLLGRRDVKTFEMFRPTVTIYADGQVELSPPAAPGMEDQAAELWITATTDLIDGLALLESDAG